MATYITVEQQRAAQLLEANRRLTASNRANLAQSEQAKRKQAEAERQAKARQAQQPSKTAAIDAPRRSRQPLDELAAFRRLSGGYLMAPDVPAYVNGGLPVKSKGLGTFSMSKHNILGQWIEGYYVRDFAIVQGPAVGTYAVTRLNENEPSINYLFASNFAPSVGVDLASIMDLNGALEFDPIARGNAVLEVDPLIYPSPLVNPRTRVGNYRSHTFEFLIKVAPLSTYVLFNGFAFALTNISYTEIIMQAQRITGIASNPTGDPNHYDPTTKEFSAYLYAGEGTSAPSFLRIDPIAVGQWVHVALSKSASLLSLYINGKRVIEATTVPNYWELYAGFDAFSGSLQDFSVINGEMPLMCMVSIPSGTPGEVAVHGVRFTPRALYSGASFTPPASITSLA